MQIFIINLLWALSVAGLAWYIGQAALQITYVTLADGRQQERRLPLLFRLLLPLAPNIVPFFRRDRFAKMRTEVNRRIVMAGYEGLLSAEEFFALRVLVPMVVGTLLALAFLYLTAHMPERMQRSFAAREAFVCPLFYLLGFTWPGLWLQRSIRDRHRRIERALPFVLDLLTLSVEAGLDFMSAIKRIIERRAVDALGEELIRAFREVQLGRTRREALRFMADRINQTDVSSVVSALVQADELGVSIGNMLRIQADLMRTRRFQRAEKLANEAPVKMLFPLTVFIFPSVFMVLLGPIIVQWLRAGL
ncbi:MAG: type II secretion system F family protein [Verrucomicrobia bacterium]|nr:MAG: type II secretion system F family protein [Verrucomicrobiota bacterium]